ncbi:MAG: hypothetical protein AB1603_08955, partial [Chloroflexota bacterium]
MKKARGSKKTRLPTADLGGIAEAVRQDLSAKDMAREKTLRQCREVIRHSADAIRAVHREEMAEARKLLKAARTLLDEVRRTLAGHEDLLYTGLVHDA